MKKVFRLKGLECANCAGKIERDVQAAKGIIKAELAFMTQRFSVEAEDTFSAEELKELVVKIVKKYESDVAVC